MHPGGATAPAGNARHHGPDRLGAGGGARHRHRDGEDAGRERAGRLRALLGGAALGGRRASRHPRPAPAPPDRALPGREDGLRLERGARRGGAARARGLRSADRAHRRHARPSVGRSARRSDPGPRAHHARLARPRRCSPARSTSSSGWCAWATRARSSCVCSRSAAWCREAASRSSRAARRPIRSSSRTAPAIASASASGPPPRSSSSPRVADE